MVEKLKCDVLVAGGGLVGLTAARALALADRNVVLCAPGQNGNDPRTTAILDTSVRYLDSLGLWEAVADQAHPLQIMRLVDATSRLFRFPQTDFNSGEIGLEAFGYNIRNQLLMDAIMVKLDEDDRVTIIDGHLSEIVDTTGTIKVALKTREGMLEAETGFLVGADGRNSAVRTHFGHGEKSWSYPQTAIVLDFEHEHSSQRTSTEFHNEAGPFTVVPQGDCRAGLVWLEQPAEAERVMALEPDALNRLVEHKMHSWLGKVSLVNTPKSFPMAGMIANRFGDDNHALVGEAAHVFPPIGAQGFNLGIRDVSTLVSVLGRFANLENPGLQYHLQRSTDIKSRTHGVDILNRTLLSSFLPAQAAKSVAMLALGSLSPLRKQAMKTGVGAYFGN